MRVAPSSVVRRALTSVQMVPTTAEQQHAGRGAQRHQPVDRIDGPEDQDQQAHQTEGGEQQRHAGHDQQLNEIDFLLFQLDHRQPDTGFHHADGIVMMR